MKLLVGLGNPGTKYARNRHNIGFMALEAIGEAHGFGPWRSRFQGEISEGRLGTEKVLLLKPQTFMNLSGDSVQSAAAFYKLAPADIIVLHDELDLAPGKLRVKTGGGHAGHNGLRSISAHLGPDFTRVRIGIGHPGDKRLVSNYVLADFAKADADWLEPLLNGIATSALLLAKGDTAGFAGAVGTAAKPTDRKPDAPSAAPASKASASPAPEEPATDLLSNLRRLADRFR